MTNKILDESITINPKILDHPWFPLNKNVAKAQKSSIVNHLPRGIADAVQINQQLAYK